MVSPIDSSLLSGLGLRSVQDAQESSKEKNKLGQDDFMALMVAQLRNQDPFEPMENGDFIAQIAQFSQVSGLLCINYLPIFQHRHPIRN